MARLRLINRCYKILNRDPIMVVAHYFYVLLIVFLLWGVKRDADKSIRMIYMLEEFCENVVLIFRSMGVLLLLSLIVVGLKEFFLNCLCIKNSKCNFNYFLWHHSIIYAVFRSHLSISIEWTKRLLFKTEFFHCWTFNTFNFWLSKIRQKLFFLALTSKPPVRNFFIHRKYMQMLIKSLLHKLQMFSLTNFISNKRWYVEIYRKLIFSGKKH